MSHASLLGHQGPAAGADMYGSRTLNGGSSASRATGSSHPLLAATRNACARVEAVLERAAEPIRPYLPTVARALLVVTFIEDSVRIVSQWPEQMWYMTSERSFPRVFASMFLSVNVMVMLTASVMAVARVRTTLAVALLFSVLVGQSIGYGLILDLGFFMRALAVTGGLLMLAAEDYTVNDRARARAAAFPGLPDLSATATRSRTTYIQLAGRLLLVLLFSSFLVGARASNEPISMLSPLHILRVLCVLLGAVACVMVAVGFQARRSALMLVLILSIFNSLINNWWSLHHHHPHRDFMKYDFFQSFSIMGGLLILSNLGPGEISIDEKKKEY